MAKVKKKKKKLKGEMSKKEKAEYVRSAEQTRPHQCHWPDCEEEVPPAMWGCKKHWFRLPKWLRNKLWEVYRPGQEIDGTPSKQYLAVVQEIREWIEEYGD